MNNIIEINNLNFNYENKIIFNNFNLAIKKGVWLSLVGPNGAGKSTLVKILLGLYKADGQLMINNLILSPQTLMSIRKDIGVIFENPNYQFIGATVKDDIAFTLENLNYNHQEITEKIKAVANLLNINHLLDSEPYKLSGGEKQKAILASILVLQPKIIILDEALTMIDPVDRLDILALLKKIQQKTKVTIINISNDLEETLYGDNILILDKGHIIIEGETIAVLEQDNLLHQLGLKLPFMIDLSIKLKFYNLIDHIILDMDEMIDSIWK